MPFPETPVRRHPDLDQICQKAAAIIARTGPREPLYQMTPFIDGDGHPQGETSLGAIPWDGHPVEGPLDAQIGP